MSGILPKGWVQTNLGTVSTHPQYGWTCSSTKIGSLKLLRTTDISSGKVDWDNVPYCSEVPDQIEKFVLGKNDIVVSRAGSIGVSFCLSESDLEYKAVFASYLIRFRPLIPATFVYYYLKSSAYWQFISASQLGIAVPNVNASKLAELPLPLPPLTEQKRIIAKLDAIMPRIHSVKERLEKIPAILKRFRQSVLTAAVTGKLTEKWRGEHPETESADILLEKIKIYRMKNCTIASKLSAIEKKESGNSSFLDEEWSYSLPDTWMHCEIDSIGDVFNGSTPSRKVDSYWNGQINWVRSGEVANVRISSTRERITQEGFENSSVKLFPKGTVLVAMIGEGKTRGQAAILDVESTCNQNVAAIVINHGYVLSEYLYNWFLMQYERNRTLGSGSGPQALNCQRVREIDFMLPPFDEQKEIVRQVDKLFALADKVEEHYRKARARVDALSQSVLAKAFRGELVPQDPDDEPAEKLLQRIQEEKEKMENELKTASRSARGTRRNGAKMQHTRPEEKQAGEP